MSLPAYPEYKDSGVEWLGAVPSGWEIKRLGFYFDERREKVSDTDFPPLSVTKNGVVPQLETAAKSDDGDNRKKVLSGDFVINSRSDRKGSSGISAHDGSVSLINTVLRPRRDVFGGFVHHLLRSRPFQEEYYRYGKGIVADLWSTNYSEMRAISLSLPSLSEQRSIATFLDYETAKIDALIAEQERLLALLAEKRQATISQAVTKGLNPDVPYKDSGVEWLGDIPKHWDLKRLKYFLRLVTEKSDGSNNKVALEHIEGWTGRYIASESDFEGQGVAFQKNDLLFGKLRPYLAKAYLATEDGEAVGDFHVLRPSVDVDPKFAQYQVLNSKFIFALNGTTLGAKMPRANWESLGSMPFVVPSIAEQKLIINYLESETAKFDVLFAGCNKAIELLTERRSALISAAVTGKIDVRNYLAKEAA